MELVKAVPGLSPDVWLDGVALAVKPDICEEALLDTAKRRRFRQLVQKSQLDLFAVPHTALPWNDLRRTLTGAGAVQIDERANTVSEGHGWQAFRGATGKLPAGFIGLVAEALKNVTDNAADLVQAGVDASEVKRAIHQARTGTAVE